MNDTKDLQNRLRTDVLWHQRRGNETIAKDCEEAADALEAQGKRIAELEDDLQWVERCANHHGQKAHVTAEQALSFIQHYPPIKAITKAYSDGKMPTTLDPYAEITALKAELTSAKDLAQGRLEQMESDRKQALVWRDELAALREQEPVMVYEGRCIWDCGDGGHQDVTMLKMIAKGTKLYAAPGAKP